MFKNDKSNYKLIDISISQTRLQQYMNTLPYFTLADILRKREEETFELIFEHITILLDSTLIDQNFIRQGEMILETQMSKCTQMILSNVQKYLARYKKQLLRLFLLLSGQKGKQANEQVSLPNAIDEFLASSRGESFKNEQERVYLYLICSTFMPMFFKIMSRGQLEPHDLTMSNSDSICLAMRFDQMSALYIDEHSFQRQILQHPLRILNHFPTLEGYQIYEKVNFTQLLDEVQCLVSSNLVDRKMSSLIETFNFSKVVHLAELFNNRPKTNNALLNAIQRLNILKIFSENSNPEEKIQQSSFFCLTLPITKNFFSKMRQFFESLPPEFAPLAKYDILSFGSGEQFNTLLLRFATSQYWQHCPQSQLLEIYYLCNETCVQWISLPSQFYKQSGRIRVWSQEQIENLCSPRFQSCRGVQKCGDFVIIGQGNEYFWRVKKGYGTATFVKWSILLKSKNQIKNYIQIVERKEKQLLQSGWNLDIPHKRLILNYLSHQYMNLELEIMKKMIHFVKEGIKKEQKLLTLMCNSFQKQLILNKSQLSSKYRICGQCGKQIINIFSHFQDNAICLLCLHDQIKKRDKSYRFQVNYMCKPSDLDLFFKNIPNTVMRQVSVNFEQKIEPNQMYQETFCEGKYLGWFQSRHCLGQLTKSNIIIKKHISSYLPSLKLHVFAKRSYFCTLQSTIKCYALKKCTSKQEEAQMRTLLTFFAQHCLNSQQKFKIRQDIYNFYMEDNYVMEALHALKEKIIEN